MPHDRGSLHFSLGLSWWGKFQGLESWWLVGHPGVLQAPPMFLCRYFLCLPMNKTKGIPFLNKLGKIRIECGRWIESHEPLWAVNLSAFPHLKFCGKNSYLLSVPDCQLCPVPAGLLANLCLWLEMEDGVKDCWWFWTIQLPIRKAACHRIVTNCNALYPFMPWDASVQCRCSSSVSLCGTKSNWRISL